MRGFEPDAQEPAWLVKSRSEGGRAWSAADTTGHPQRDGDDAQEIGLPQSMPLQQLPKAIAGPEYHAVEVFFRQLQLAADLTLFPVMQIELQQDLPVARDRHFIEYPPGRRRPLWQADMFPLRVIVRVLQLIQSFRTGYRGPILAPVIAQMIDSDAVQVAAHVLGACDLSASQLFECGHGGILQDVGGDVGIPHASQDECAQPRIVTIH